MSCPRSRPGVPRQRPSCPGAWRSVNRTSDIRIGWCQWYVFLQVHAIRSRSWLHLWWFSSTFLIQEKITNESDSTLRYEVACCQLTPSLQCGNFSDLHVRPDPAYSDVWAVNPLNPSSLDWCCLYYSSCSFPRLAPKNNVNKNITVIPLYFTEPLIGTWEFLNFLFKGSVLFI